MIFVLRSRDMSILHICSRGDKGMSDIRQITVRFNLDNELHRRIWTEDSTNHIQIL